jgi:hypothetical protein
MTNPNWPVETDPPAALVTETKFVRMYHPELNTEAEFPADSVGHHAVAGWQVIDEPQPVEAAEAVPAHISRAEADAAQNPPSDGEDQADAAKTPKAKAGNRRASQADATTGSSEQEQ